MRSTMQSPGISFRATISVRGFVRACVRARVHACVFVCVFVFLDCTQIAIPLFRFIFCTSTLVAVLVQISHLRFSHTDEIKSNGATCCVSIIFLPLHRNSSKVQLIRLQEKKNLTSAPDPTVSTAADSCVFITQKR